MRNLYERADKLDKLIRLQLEIAEIRLLLDAVNFRIRYYEQQGPDFQYVCSELEAIRRELERNAR